VIYADFETFCEVDLKKAGAYRYVSDPSFEPLLLSWAVDDRDFQVHDFGGRFDVPDELRDRLNSGETVAGFGQFDRICFRRIGFDIEPARYVDVMILCAEMGMPRSLKLAAREFGCSVGKEEVGKAAISRFCKLYRGRRWGPDDSPDLWEQFVHYALVDGVLLREIHRKAKPLSKAEQMLYEMDCRMADRGIRIDIASARQATQLAEELRAKANQLMAEITDGAVTSTQQAARLAAYLGVESISEQNLAEAMPKLSGNQRTAAKLRQANSKLSVSKLDTMIQAADPVDHRVRGALAFCGTITRRWAGRLFQPQNLPRKCFSPDEFDEFMAVCRESTLGELKKAYPDPLAAFSKSLRGMLVPGPGKVFAVYDFAQIEARILAWIAGQLDAVQAYRDGVDQYIRMAAAVFGVPEDRVTDAQRFIGKTLVLGAGYNLGGAGFQRNLARMGVVVEEEDAAEYIARFRETFFKLPVFWRLLMDTTFRVLETGQARAIRDGSLLFRMESPRGPLLVRLPSGSTLAYNRPKVCLVPAPWDEEQKIKAVRAIDPKSGARYIVGPQTLTENVCSTISRDIMARGMWRCERAGFAPVMSVHDEVVLEVEDSPAERARAVELVPQLLCQAPPWGPDLPLKVEGKLMHRYGK
jgi:DNA polymerase